MGGNRFGFETRGSGNSWAMEGKESHQRVRLRVLMALRGPSLINWRDANEGSHAVMDERGYHFTGFVGKGIRTLVREVAKEAPGFLLAGGPNVRR